MKFTFGGGLNELNDIAIDPEEAIEGQNFDLSLGNTKFKPRPPVDLLGTTPNAGEIRGIHQLIKRNNTKTTLVTSGNTCYEWDGLTTFTSKGTVNTSSEFHDFDWDLDQTIIITDRNLANPVLEWDGTTLSNLTHAIPTVTSFYAKYGLVNNNRAILANVKTDSAENPHMVVFSAFENRQSFDTSARGGAGSFATGDEAFYLLSPDMKPINGLVLFQNIVICSTLNGGLFKLVGNDATNYQWVDFYSGSSAVGTNSLVNAGDDVFYMRQGGVIESLRSTDTFGDVGTDDISLPVRDTVKNSIESRAVYDQTNRKIYFFLSSKVLVLYKDLLSSGKSPFSLYKTTLDSGLNTKAARYVEYQTSTDKTVLFGDDIGNIYDMNGIGTGDAGTNSILVKRKLPLLPVDFRSVIQGRIFYRKKGACELAINYEWGDEASSTGNSVTLSSSDAVSGSYFNGTGIILEDDSFFDGVGEALSTDSFFGSGGSAAGAPVSKGFSAVGKGTSLFITLSIDTSEDFEIDYIEV